MTIDLNFGGQYHCMKYNYQTTTVVVDWNIYRRFINDLIRITSPYVEKLFYTV